MTESYTLITGSSSGIGRIIALRLGSSRRLILAGRNQAKLDSVLHEINRPDGTLIWLHDLSQPESVGESLAELLHLRNAYVDHFVHSAGVFEVQPVRGVQIASLHNLFNVNLFSAVEIIRQLVRPRVNKDCLKTITFISSIASKLGMRGYSAYAASKGALNALSRSLAVELAPGIRVNTVLPGAIETESTKHMFAFEKQRTAIHAAYPLGLGTVQDIANAVEFVISDKARWITGQELIVDGGRSVI